MELSTKLSGKGRRAPEAIPYMPAGVHYIRASVNGKAARRMVMVDQEACCRLQADLERLQAEACAGRRARPVVYFDHQQGAAAGHPKRFVWDDEKGILLEMEDWTSAGRRAVEGGDYSYVSPAFRMGKGSHRVLGLVGGVEVASLVNDPAFEEIDSIAACHLESGARDGDEVEYVCAFLPPRAEVEKVDGGFHNGVAAEGGGVMIMEAEMKKLLGLPEDADDAAVAAAVKRLVRERDAHRKEAEEAKAGMKKKEEELEAAKAEAAGSRVDKLVEKGVIAPKDEERIKAARRLAMDHPQEFDAVFAHMQAGSPVEPVVAGKVPSDRDFNGKSAAELISLGL